MKVGRVALDGTKMKANASKHKAMSHDRMLEKEKQLKEEVQQLLEQAETADADEDTRHGKDRRGDELPAELARRETRLKKIREAKRALAARAREKAEKEGSDPKEARPRERPVATSRSGNRASWKGVTVLCKATMRKPRWSRTFN